MSTITHTNHSIPDGLPVPPSVAPAVIASLDDREDRTLTVVHVDDEPDFADMTKIFLERFTDDLEVITETSPLDVLETLETTAVDGIVSDYQMPRMDGLELLETVREDHPHLPFILCTARGSEEVASEAIAAGVTDYIQKQTDTEQYEVLANRLTNAVDRYRTRRQLWETLAWSSQLMSQSLAGVYVVKDGTFVYVNEYFADLFGYQPEDLIGEAPGDLGLEDHPDEAAGSCFEAVPPDTTTARYHSEAETRSGRPVAFEVEVSHIEFYGEPAVLGTVVEAESTGRGTGESP